MPFRPTIKDPIPREIDDVPEIEQEILTDRTLDESAPLLGPPNQNADRPPLQTPEEAKRASRFMFFMLLIVVVIDMGGFLQTVPLKRIFEAAFCTQYYQKENPRLIGDDGQIDELLCKVPEIQAKVAMLSAWISSVDQVPSLVTAVLYGVLSDKYGRKLVLSLGLIGMVLDYVWLQSIAYFSNTFPIYLVLLGSAFQFIGGGATVAAATIYTMIADIFPQEQRARAYFQTMAAAISTQTISGPIASLLMRQYVWYPMWLGLAMLVLGVFCLPFIPETAPMDANGNITFAKPTANHSSNDNEDGEDKERSYLQMLAESRFILTSPRLLGFTLTFLTQTFWAIPFGGLLVQYTSERFLWPLDQANYLIVLRAAVNLVLFLLILPVFGSFLKRQYNLSTNARDLLITRISVSVLTLGTLCAALSFTPVLLVGSIIIAGLGQGFNTAARSLITSMVQPSQVSRLLAVTAILDTVGLLVASPIMATVFSAGLKLPGLGKGLLYFVSAGIFAVSSLPFWFPAQRESVDEDNDEEERE